MGEVEDCTPLIGVLFRDQTEGVNLKIGKRGNFKGACHHNKCYFIQQVLFNCLGLLESRGEVLSLTGKPLALVSYPETKAETMTQKINKLFFWVSLNKSVEE